MSKKINNKKKNEGLLANLIFGFAIVLLIGALVLMIVKSVNSSKQNRIKEISYQEYSEIKNNNDYTILLLTASYCSHCKDYKPYVNYAANEYNLEIYDIDISDNLTEAQFNDLHSFNVIKDAYNEEGNAIIPTPVTVILKNGVEIDSKAGDIGYDGFVNMLEENRVIKKK